jgi:LPXTG-site transpeptidase (sortase) family protein
MKGRLSKRKKLISLIAFLILLVVALFLYHHKHSVQTAPPGIKNVVTHTSSNPSEKPINSFNYVSTATGDEPKYISLPTIHESGYIEKVGIDQYHQVASPDNVNLAGWYVNSLTPGQDGLSIIDGHVDGKTGPGIFLRLSELKIGDNFEVDLANGKKLTYNVEQITSVKAANVPNVLFAKSPNIKSQLNLITCYGTFNYSSDQYDQRTIVVSELVSQS